MKIYKILPLSPPTNDTIYICDVISDRAHYKNLVSQKFGPHGTSHSHNITMVIFVWLKITVETKTIANQQQILNTNIK